MYPGVFSVTKLVSNALNKTKADLTGEPTNPTFSLQTNTKQYLQTQPKSFAMSLPVSKCCQLKDRKPAKQLAKFLWYDHTPQSTFLVLSPGGWKEWTVQKRGLSHRRALPTKGSIEKWCINQEQITEQQKYNVQYRHLRTVVWRREIKEG